VEAVADQATTEEAVVDQALADKAEAKETVAVAPGQAATKKAIFLTT
jgi:hypothetical protein